jgi:hypothetical protein
VRPIRRDPGWSVRARRATVHGHTAAAADATSRGGFDAAASRAPRLGCLSANLAGLTTRCRRPPAVAMGEQLQEWWMAGYAPQTGSQIVVAFDAAIERRTAS